MKPSLLIHDYKCPSDKKGARIKRQSLRNIVIYSALLRVNMLLQTYQ